MNMFHHGKEKREIELLEKIEADLRRIEHDVRPRLSFIKIRFGGHMQGPVTLTIGQKTTATVLGFDQNGAAIPIDFASTPVVWSLDNATLDSSTPQPDGSDVVASLAAGVANLTATVGSFSDTETVTNVAQAPVLASIKIDFSTPA